MHKKAIILVSGGMDSLVTLEIAILQGVEPYILHINYGQNTQKKELEAFKNIKKYYNINDEHSLIIDIDYLKKIGGSNLTDNNFDKQNIDSIPNSYVPFRNSNIIAIATSWAEIIEVNSIFIGASEVDNNGYPDCRRIFFDALERVIELGTKPNTNIKIETPLIQMTKKDIVKKGTELNVLFELSWSCYYNDEESCGICDSCKLRLSGFRKAGVKDPIKYKKYFY